MKFSHGLLFIWDLAAREAAITNFSEIEPVHFLLAILKIVEISPNDFQIDSQDIESGILEDLKAEIKDIQKAFDSISPNSTFFRRKVRQTIQRPNEINNPPDAIHRSMESRKLFRLAEHLARSDNKPSQSVGIYHLLEALAEIPNPPWQPILVDIGFNNLQQIVFVDRSPVEPAKNEKLSKTPLLDRFGRNLTEIAKKGELDPLIGRKDELRKIAQVLLQKRKNNVLLVGEAGVGKTCIVEGLAQLLISPSISPLLKGKQLIQISMPSLVAGTKYRGEFEERLTTLLDEVSQNDGIILFIDEIHALMGAGGEGASDASQILKPALAGNKIRCIGATTVKEYREYIEKDEAFMRRFELVLVEEPNRDETIIILEGLRPRFEDHHGVFIESDAIQSAVDLSIQYLPEIHLPDKAIDLIDQACSRARLKSISSSGSSNQHPSIFKEDIAFVISNRCRIPLERLTDDQSNKLLKLEEYLSNRVIGQEKAIRAVAEAIRVSRAGLKSPNKPIGVFLLVGPTGTGKTELAKAIAESLFGDERSLIRFDMSEYKEKHSISKLIGAPPGYIGYDDEGQLTGRVRSKPYSVVLFDEIEKAHSEILDVLLQVFDEGVLTDAQGRRTFFRDTLIIMTSNLGNQIIKTRKPLGFIAQDKIDNLNLGKPDYMEAIQATLRPELINRITETIYFDNLDKLTLRKIIDKAVAQLQKQLLEKKLTLRLTDGIYDELMLRGYSQEFGARAMERVINEMIVKPLSHAILAKQIPDEKEICIDYRNGKVVLE
jgi:ATP-dependent Clp protease ATP-binding subunit ClpC